MIYSLGVYLIYILNNEQSLRSKYCKYVKVIVILLLNREYNIVITI